jgi:hypothetical protein
VSLEDAFKNDLTISNCTIKAKTGYLFHENLTLDRSTTVTIDGGYTNLSGSSDGVGSTIFQGTGDHMLSIKNGILNVREMKVSNEAVILTS